MIFDTLFQPYVFLTCVFLGGVVFFAYKFTHLPQAKNLVLLALQDIVFCIICFFVTWRGLLFANCGQIRWFCVAGILLGFWLGKNSAGICVDNIFCKLYNFCAKQKKDKKDG